LYTKLAGHTLIGSDETSQYRLLDVTIALTAICDASFDWGGGCEPTVWGKDGRGVRDGSRE